MKENKTKHWAEWTIEFTSNSGDVNSIIVYAPHQGTYVTMYQENPGEEDDEIIIGFDKVADLIDALSRALVFHNEPIEVPDA